MASVAVRVPSAPVELSQVVLTFGIPVPLIPLVIVTNRTDSKGVYANKRSVAVSSWTIAIATSSMNAFVIY